MPGPEDRVVLPEDWCRPAQRLPPAAAGHLHGGGEGRLHAALSPRLTHTNSKGLFERGHSSSSKMSLQHFLTISSARVLSPVARSPSHPPADVPVTDSRAVTDWTGRAASRSEGTTVLLDPLGIFNTQVGLCNCLRVHTEALGLMFPLRSGPLLQTKRPCPPPPCWFQLLKRRLQKKKRFVKLSLSGAIGPQEPRSRVFSKFWQVERGTEERCWRDGRVLGL